MVETDVAENFYVDPLLQKACQPVVDVACNHIEPGDGKSVIILTDIDMLEISAFMRPLSY